MVQGACHAARLDHLTQPQREAGHFLAPAWHTRALVALLLAVAAAGVLLGPETLQPVAVSVVGVRAYLPLVLVNVLLCAYVSGVGLERLILAELVGRVRGDGRRLFADSCLGVALVLALLTAENVLQSWLGLPESIAAHALMPSRIVEKLLWLPVAAVIGFSEELVYRGYLQRQLAALSGSLPCGVLAQAALFGIAHGEQGSWAVGRFTVYALAFGCVAAWRRSLVPGIWCHVAVDSLAAWGG